MSEMNESMAVGAETPKLVNASDLQVINGSLVPKQTTEETKRFRESFQFFGPATAAYALFYAFCMYKNPSGITFPFFVAGSLWYFCSCMKKLELTLKGGSRFIMVSTVLLGIATFCTDDLRIIALNKTGIFLLLMCFLLTQFFHTEKWGLEKFAGAIPAALLSSILELERPIRDMTAFVKKGKSEGTRRAVYVGLGLVIACPIFFVIAALLSSADAFFRQITDGLLAMINLGSVFGVIFHVVFWYFGTYMLVSNLCKKSLREEVKDHRHGEPILAITVTSLLTVMYLLFSGIQIFGLFLGQLQLPEGYTYAQYAREGFFQLLGVSVFNLIAVLFCLAFFKESKILKGILTVMSLCTFIMIASSAMRMILYISSYDLTFLRIIVLWALAVLFLLFVCVVVSIYKPDFPLFRYGMVIVTVCYIGLAFSHPDYICAKYNLEYSVKEADWRYLRDLSADAAPVILPYLEDHEVDSKSARYVNYVKDVYNDQGIRNFNLSRYWATTYLH